MATMDTPFAVKASGKRTDRHSPPVTSSAAASISARALHSTPRTGSSWTPPSEISLSTHRERHPRRGTFGLPSDSGRRGNTCGSTLDKSHLYLISMPMSWYFCPKVVADGLARENGSVNKGSEFSYDRVSDRDAERHDDTKLDCQLYGSQRVYRYGTGLCKGRRRGRTSIHEIRKHPHQRLTVPPKRPLTVRRRRGKGSESTTTYLPSKDSHSWQKSGKRYYVATLTEPSP